MSRKAWIAIGVAVVLGACSKKSEPPAGSTIPADKEIVVGDASTAQVTVPAGAVDKSVSISLAPEPPESIPGAVGRVWNIQVDGQDHFTFKKPVRLSLPIDRALVEEGVPVTLSRWDGKRWQKVRGSRVEGDRVVGEVDHFSKHAPAQDKKEKAETPVHPFVNVGSWDVQIDITASGNWGHQDEVSRSNWNLSRGGSIHFRLSEARPDRRANKGAWITPYKSTDPRDETRVTGMASDYGFETDQDHSPPKTGNVYYYHTLDGGGSAQELVHNTLAIDAAKGTWTLSSPSSVQAGTALTGYWDTWGRTRPQEKYPVHVGHFTVSDRLPAEVGVIKTTVILTKDNYAGWVGPSHQNARKVEGTAVITLTPSGGFEARIRGPYEVRRADEVTLDGTTSLGEISSYHWKVRVDASCPDAPPPMEHDGPTWSFHPLWDFQAQLEITGKDGRKDETTKRFKVVPRRGEDWQIKYKTKKGDLDQKIVSEHIQFGINQCNLHGEAIISGHKIHSITDTSKETQTWLDAAYFVGKIADDGPFNGLYFVKEAHLDVDRIERVNINLKPGGTVHNLNTVQAKAKEVARLRQLVKDDPGNEGAKKQLEQAQNHDEGAVPRLLRQVKDHEELHSTLMRDAVRAMLDKDDDPGKKIEKIVTATRSQVKKQADDLIRPAETDLVNASHDREVKKVLRTMPGYAGKIWIWVPKVDGGLAYIELGPLCELGDEWPAAKDE